MRLWALVSIVALFLPTSTFSQDAGPTTSFKNGAQLYQACTAASESQNMAFCIGYVMGVSDSLQSLHLTCSPKEATPHRRLDVRFVPIGDTRVTTTIGGSPMLAQGCNAVTRTV
jgi:hypothetical protein